MAVLPSKLLQASAITLLYAITSWMNVWVTTSSSHLVSAFVSNGGAPLMKLPVRSSQHYWQHEESSFSISASSWSLYSSQDDTIDDESTLLKRKADKLRAEIRALEETLNSSRRAAPAAEGESTQEEAMSLKGKKVLVVGANGRLGSMVCRYLLRNNPTTQVVAAVHYVGEASTRGYGRLSYEVGAEDGQGFINPAWDSEDRNAYFQFTDEMKSYNLQNLRVVEVELLDPVQCMTITEGIDCVVWCATDFNGNKPRAVSGLNIAFLFRAVSNPTKGRVEIEGLINILSGLKNSKQSRKWNADRVIAAPTTLDGRGRESFGRDTSVLVKPNDPTSFVLVSASDSAFDDFETPFGSFKGLKRDGERIVMEQFPSLSACILRMSRFDDNFVGEDLEILREDEGQESLETKSRRRINRRDAARAAAEALTDPACKGKTYEIWTTT